MRENRKKSNENTRNVWTRPLVFSLAFHLTVISMFFFVPESMPTRRIDGPTVYEVDLVQLPAKPPKAKKEAALVSPAKVVAGSGSEKVVNSRRIIQPAKEEKPVVIGKRVIERETEKKKPEKKVEEPKVNASKLIDQAIGKIERKVKAEKKDHLSAALSKIQSQVEEEEKGNPPGDVSETGMAIRLYQLEVAERIKHNWSYPVAISNPGEYKNIEAVVVVTVRENGSIIGFSVKKKSSNTLFDASVLKAIERSDPLPHSRMGIAKVPMILRLDSISVKWRDLEIFAGKHQ